MLLKLSMKGLSTSQDRARSSWFFWAFFMYHEFVTDDFGRRVSEILWIYEKKERIEYTQELLNNYYLFFGFILFSRCWLFFHFFYVYFVCLFLFGFCFSCLDFCLFGCFCLFVFSLFFFFFENQHNFNKQLDNAISLPIHQ